MKKAALFIMLLAGTLSLKADGYAYLTFETADGKKVSVPLTSLTLSLSASELTAGTGITSLGAEAVAESDESAVFYDLRGRRVSRDQMRSGIYIVKSKNKTAKIFVK